MSTERSSARWPLAWAWQCGAALLAGGVAALGFAPIGWFWLPLPALALLFHLQAQAPTVWRGALLGFAFGLGYFLVGVSWVFVSLHYFGHMPLILAVIATVLFCAYLALFPALAGALVALGRQGQSVRTLLVAPAAFVLLEWTRGWLFTGFPWLGLGASQAPDSPLVGFAPMGGEFAVAWLLAVSAGLLAACHTLAPAGRRWQAGALGLAATIWVAGAGLKQIDWSRPYGEPFAAALLQGNVSQDRKWKKEHRAATLASYLTLAQAEEARLIVFPETALPMFFDDVPRDYLRALLAIADASGGNILLGTVERAPAALDSPRTFAYRNAVLAFGADPPQAYRKSHLVPFGEFIPPGFHWVLGILQIPLTDFSRGSIDQRPLALGGQKVAVNICYEDGFGSEIIRQLPEATVLVNVSNLAWFGRSFAADQHFQMSQLRALETSRWMLRATNTGVTGAIDHQGRTVSRLAQFETGTLRVMVQGRTGQTPYVVAGNGPVVVVMILAVLLGFVPRARLGTRKP